MILFFLGLTAVLLVGMLSRDHDITASEQTRLAAELHFDDAVMPLFPNEIHLTPCDASAFTTPDAMRDAREGLVAEGFASAGSFAIDEMPGVCVTLMSHRRQSLCATVYDHARAGVWVEAISRYTDGKRWTHTTLMCGGLGTRPGNELVSMPGASIAELLARARGDRPPSGLVTLERDDIAKAFEADYAAWIAARKQQSAQRTTHAEDDEQQLAA